jgi:predicted  nucleic acid-binding Zn ribbon protein
VDEKRALYKLPNLGVDYEHSSLNSWAKTYRAWIGFVMASGTGERFGIVTLSSEHSGFTREGRQVARDLDRKTGKPFYVFLSIPMKMGRRLSDMQAALRLDEAWNGFYDFKCDHSRLVSIEAWDEATPLSQLHP